VDLTKSMLVVGCALAIADDCRAAEDIEFVAEHLAEVPMDNRYATLPIWSADQQDTGNTVELQAAFSTLGSGNLEVSGPMFSVGLRKNVSSEWSVGGFVFDDPLRVHSNHEDRPLQTLFAPSTPIARPVDAHFSNLDGTATDLGAGFFVSQERHGNRLGDYAWLAGVLWQRVSLNDFRLDYEIAAGPSIGTTGQIDFDNTYTHVVPFVGIEIPRQRGAWLWNAHALYAMPLPRRGVVGHITGPGFDIHGDTQDVGAGKHFGDPSLTVGFTFTYAPAHLSVDVGALVSQALIEQWVHRGIERNFVISVSWRSK
jgi:hypothetical protein